MRHTQNAGTWNCVARPRPSLRNEIAEHWRFYAGSRVWTIDWGAMPLLAGVALELRYPVGNERILLQLLEDSIFVFVFGLTYRLHFLPKCHKTGKRAF